MSIELVGIEPVVILSFVMNINPLQCARLGCHVGKPGCHDFLIYHTTRSNCHYRAYLAYNEREMSLIIEYGLTPILVPVGTLAKTVHRHKYSSLGLVTS